MEKCFLCGTETRLYFGIDPICLNCNDDISKGKEPKRPKEKAAQAGAMNGTGREKG